MKSSSLERRHSLIQLRYAQWVNPVLRSCVNYAAHDTPTTDTRVKNDAHDTKATTTRVDQDALDTERKDAVLHVAPIHVMETSHYIVQATVGSSFRVMLPVRVVFDRGSADNTIRRNGHSPDWQAHIVQDVALAHLGDSSENLIHWLYEVQFSVHFDNALYCTNWFVVANLSSPILVGTKFMNRAVEGIWWI